MGIWPLGHLEQWHLVLRLMFLVLATALASIRVICVLVLAFDKNLTVTAYPAVGVAFKAKRRPNLKFADWALEADHQVRMTRRDIEAGIVKGVVNFFSVHDFVLSLHLF